MTAVLFNLDSDPILADQLAGRLNAETGRLNQRLFPDHETYLRVDSDVSGQDTLVFCNLFQPNDKIVPLLFLADTLRDLGASRVALITPYLCYMRQDKRFLAGECVSAQPFGRLISDHFDFLVTIDPHLHRIHSLDEVYRIPTRVVQAAPLISDWIRDNLGPAVLLGPDSESEQWVSEVARRADAPFCVLDKVRHGDREVEVAAPDLSHWPDHRPVLIDDIISSGNTMLRTLEHLQQQGAPRPLCIGVHGIFADQAYAELNALADVVTTQTIPHPSNRIAIADALAAPLREWIEA